MTRFSSSLLLASFLALSLNGAKIDEKIKSAASKLNETKQTYTSLNAKLEATAAKIVQQRQAVSAQQQHINTLVTELKAL